MPEFLTKVQLYKMHGRSPIWSIASSLLSFLELRESIKSSHNKFALHLYRDACMHAQSLQLYLTLWNLWAVVHQAPLSLGFSRQEYWSGLLCPPPGESFWPRDWTNISYGRWVLLPLMPPACPTVTTKATEKMDWAIVTVVTGGGWGQLPKMHP